MHRNISDLWGLQNQWEKINPRKTSLGQYWADFNCDFIWVAVSQMMNGGANLPLCRAPERVFNMTIKCLSFRFYCIFLSLSCKLLWPPPPLFFSATLLLLPLFTALHLYSAALEQIKSRLQFFFPSPSTYLCFMTRTKSILCCHWFFSPSSPYYPLA